MPALYTVPLYELWYKERFLYHHLVTFLSHCVSVHRNLLHSIPSIQHYFCLCVHSFVNLQSLGLPSNYLISRKNSVPI
jgi:hypothetical protein